MARFDLSNIKNPSFLKDLSIEELKLLSSQIKEEIIKQTSIHGGHLSSNLGVVDLTIALCKAFDFSKDKIVFDVGHQTYTYKLLTGRSLSSLREEGGISGFQKLNESPFDHYEGGHSSTSLSIASGMAYARDLKKENYYVVSLIGDAAIANGIAFEALNQKQNRHSQIIVLNDNSMGISPSKGAISEILSAFNKQTFTSKYKFGSLAEKFGYRLIGPVDGHDFKMMAEAFKLAKFFNAPCIVYVKTIKGKGYPLAVNDNVGRYHGVDAFDIKTGLSLKKQEITWSNTYMHLLDEVMENSPLVAGIVPATGYGSELTNLFLKYPDRMLDVGIAENHALALASGMALNGLHPVVSIYSTFLQRGYDQISHDLARMNLNITLLIDRAGLVGKDGNTHQGIYDEAYLYSIPNVVISMASNIDEARYLLNESQNNHGVFAIRYPKENVSDNKDNTSNSFGRWKCLLYGRETAVISFGPVINELLNNLKDKDITLINALYQNPIDEDMLKQLINFKKIIIFNPYATEIGFVNKVNKRLLELGFKNKIVNKCIPNDFVDHGSIEQLKEKYKLTVKDLLEIL